MLNRSETEERFQEYLVTSGLDDRISLKFSEKAVAPTSLAYEKGSARLIIGFPLEYRDKLVAGSLHHEVGTHFIRKDNDRRAGWRKREGLHASIETEEGLASLN